MPAIGQDSLESFQSALADLCVKYQEVLSALSGFNEQPEGKEKFHIDVLANTTPKFCTLNRVPLAQREKMDEIISNLLKLGIIRPSFSA